MSLFMKHLQAILFVFVATSSYAQLDTVQHFVRYLGPAFNAEALADTNYTNNAITNALNSIVHPSTNLSLDGTFLESSNGAGVELSSLLGSSDNIYTIDGALTELRTIQMSGFPLVLRASGNDITEALFRATELNTNTGGVELGIENGSGYIQSRSSGGGIRLKLSTDGGDQYIDPVTESHYGFNTSSPTKTLDIAEFTGGELLLHTSDASSLTGDLLGAIHFDGLDGGLSSVGASASIEVRASETHTVNDKGSSFVISTKSTNTNASQDAEERIEINGNGGIVIHGDNAAGDAMLITKDLGNNSNLEAVVIDNNATGTMSTNRTHRGMLIDYDGVNVDENGSNLSIYNIEAQMNLSGANASGASNVRNYTGLIRNDASSGTIDNAYGYYSLINQDDSGSAITHAHGFYSRLDDDFGDSGNGYAFRALYSGTWANKWGVYIAGETYNYLSGRLGVGIAQPSESIEVDGNVKATSFIGDGSQLTGVNSGPEISISSAAIGGGQFFGAAKTFTVVPVVNTNTANLEMTSAGFTCHTAGTVVANMTIAIDGNSSTELITGIVSGGGFVASIRNLHPHQSTAAVSHAFSCSAGQAYEFRTQWASGSASATIDNFGRVNLTHYKN